MASLAGKDGTAPPVQVLKLLAPHFLSVWGSLSSMHLMVLLLAFESHPHQCTLLTSARLFVTVRRVFEGIFFLPSGLGNFDIA